MRVPLNPSKSIYLSCCVVSAKFYCKIEKMQFCDPVSVQIRFAFRALLCMRSYCLFACLFVCLIDWLIDWLIADQNWCQLKRRRKLCLG